MQPYNPYQLPRLTRQTFTRQFESEANPGQVLELTFRRLDGPDNARMTDLWIEKEKLYIGGDDAEPLQEFPGLDGEEASRLSASILQNAAAMAVMQPGPNAHELEFFVMIAFRDEGMWNQISRFALEVNQGKAEQPEDLIATASFSEESASPVIATQS